MWTCPSRECPPTENPPEVEKPDETLRERPPFSTSELAEWLKVSVATIYGWRRMGYGPPASRIGKHISYRPSDVQRWMVQQGMVKTVCGGECGGTYWHRQFTHVEG
jgi:predicted DNA-binding transcriptional regulator AlpA